MSRVLPRPIGRLVARCWRAPPWWEPLADFVVERSEPQLRNCIDTIDTIVAGEVPFILSEGILRRLSIGSVAVPSLFPLFSLLHHRRDFHSCSRRSRRRDPGLLFARSETLQYYMLKSAATPRTEKHHFRRKARKGRPTMDHPGNCNIRCFESFIRSRC